MKGGSGLVISHWVGIFWVGILWVGILESPAPQSIGRVRV